MKLKSIFLLFSILIICSSFVYAQVTVTQVQPSSNITTTNSSVLIEYNISTDYLNNISYTWDGTSYSIYDSSLVLFMNFDNRSALGENDTYVKDLSKYGNDGTVYGGSNITWTSAGKYGGAYLFGGSTNYIRTPFTGINKYPFSVSAWAKPQMNGGEMVIFFMGNSASGAQYFQLAIASDVRATAGARNTSGQNSATAVGTIQNNTWYHVTGVWINETYRLVYLNGVAGTLNAVSVTFPTVDSIGIGMYRDSTPSAPFNGTIDNVMVFNRTLSQAEITQLYYSQLTKYDTQNWSYQSNQTGLSYAMSVVNASSPTHIINYNLCSSNATSGNICSYKTVTQTVVNKNLVSNYTSSLNIINDLFYGIGNVNTLSEYDNVSTNMDCTLESQSNYSRTRADYLNVGFKVLRMDMLLPWYVDYTKLNSTIGGDGRYNHASNVKWAYDNDNKVLLLASKVPSGLADITIAEAPCDGDRNTCVPSNYTQWCFLLRNYINNVTNNGQYLSAIAGIEVWNEPEYSAFFLNNLSSSTGNQSIRSKYYNQIYNETYNCLNTHYPTLAVGGGGFASIDVSAGQILLNNYLANFTSMMDFVSFHEYTYTADSLTEMLTRTNYVNTQCATYGANCSKIYITEWNLINKSESHTSKNKYYSAITLSDLLNVHASNVTQMKFKFDSAYNNLSCDSNGNYSMYSQFSQTYFDDYNVTRSFATYCPAGATVYTSSSEDTDIKTVTCKKGNSYSVIAINTGTESRNLTLNQYPSYLYNLENGASANQYLGIMDSYDIKYIGNGVYGNLDNYYWNKQSVLLSEVKASNSVKLTNNGALSQKVEFYTLTNTLAYNQSNAICNGFSTTIGSNDGNKNTTLDEDEDCYVLDRYNLTEGTSRQNDKLWFSSSTNTEKHIASNITDTINVTVIIDVLNCNTVGKITYTSDSGTYTKTYNNGDYTCSNDQVTLTDVPIEEAANSNKIVLTYNQAIQGICSESDNAFLDAVGLAGIIFTIVFVGAILSIMILSFGGYFNIGELNLGDFSIGMLAKAVMAIALTFLLIATMAYLIGGKYCPALGA